MTPRKTQAPKAKEMVLTQTEQLAISALLQARNRALSELQEVEQMQQKIVGEIETRLHLESGAIGTTHVVNSDEWKVVEMEGSDNGRRDI